MSVFRKKAIRSRGLKAMMIEIAMLTQVVLYEPRCDCSVRDSFPRIISVIQSLFRSTRSVKPSILPILIGCLLISLTASALVI